ncbi:hypothetical protein CROQUDRAFT_100269 [Cronartium quercuum f. sp. fusiforme G11]|uniref:Uncharacterized protein n=1 Tax=Cronartium quercuum f. sp. fusiforme G11 TaxID=708437 RepID=A0A9P6NAB3_9BASI|nr:hypothetical protein CROQUDRAFT_100269 [Cronartium quercuum f. sp. fusiforme G11]
MPKSSNLSKNIKNPRVNTAELNNPQADQAVKQGRRDYAALQKQQANVPPPPKGQILKLLQMLQ